MEGTRTRRNDNLKFIAMLTMLIDHMGHMRLISDACYTASRTIGRIAFPIFAYQIAIGFEKTSSRKAYALRLLRFALIAQIPYIWFNPEGQAQWLHFNILFLLLAGLGVLTLWEKAEKTWSQYRVTGKGSSFIQALLWGGLTCLAIAMPEGITILCFQKGIDISFEYSSYGLLMMVLFHCYHTHPIKLTSGYIVLSLFGVYLTTLWVAVKYGFQITGHALGYREAMANRDVLKGIIFGNGVHLSLQGVWFQTRSILSLPIILYGDRYQGRIQMHLPRPFGYWFYPVHIAILVFISMLYLV